MTRREVGATVSVMWVIFLIVLLLGACAYLYFVQADIAALNKQAKDAENARAQFEAGELREKEKHLALSRLVGFTDEAGGNLFSAVNAVEAKLEQVRGQFPNDIGGGDKTLEDIADRLIALASGAQQSARQATTDCETERGKRSEAETNRNSIQQSMEEQLASANNDLRDERDRAQSQKQTDDGTISNLQDQVDEVSAQMREREAEAAQRIAGMEQAGGQKDARIAQLNDKVKLVGVDEDPWDPDGEVVSVGAETGLVFVNLGSSDLLRKGVRFDVFRFGKGGELIRKGLVEIREVHPDHAIGGIMEEVSRLDPITAGDVISNPHFSKNRSKVFALLGAFPVYGKTFLENQLKALGAEVESEVNSRVDFVVLGQRAPEEDAPEVSDLPGYKLAQDLGIQMLQVRSIDRFLKP
ncbi:MAG: hypothetical protein HY812_02390 [Planctomycetes bacterium]|nr:hypothetical protein [Planctomycetota bacterium]